MSAGTCNNKPSHVQEKALELKNEGNENVKKCNYTEALLLYSEAIKLDKTNPQLYSNRSLVFLKLDQYYNAIEDAKESARIDSLWYKPYYRQAEVEFQTQNYHEALNSYHKACQLQADPAILECIIKTDKALEAQIKSDRQIPWVCSAIGFIFGVALLTLDATLPKTSVFQHHIIQALVAVVVSLSAFGLGKCYQWYTISQRKSLLEPPVDLLAGDGDDNKESNSSIENESELRKAQTPRYSKAQARQRYRKGKGL